MPQQSRTNSSSMCWRLTRTGRAGSAALLGPGGGWMTYDSVFERSNLIDGAMVVVACVVIWWLLAWRPYICLTSTALVVRNPLRLTVIPLAEVVEPDPGGIRVARRSGRPIYAWAVQKWNLSLWLNRRARADDVVDAINGRRRLTNQTQS